MGTSLHEAILWKWSEERRACRIEVRGAAPLATGWEAGVGRKPDVCPRCWSSCPVPLGRRAAGKEGAPSPTSVALVPRDTESYSTKSPTLAP